VNGLSVTERLALLGWTAEGGCSHMYSFTE